MSAGTVKITGGAEVMRELKALPEKVAKKLTRRSMRAGAKVIANAVKGEVPTRTGLYRKSIKVSAGKRKKDRIRFHIATGTKNYSGKAFYGAMVEFGHRLGSRKLGTNRKEIKGRHDFKKAFDAKKDAAIAAVISTARYDLAHL